MASNLLAAERFISTKLKASTALTSVVSQRIFSEIAPAKTPYPLVVYKWLGGTDVAVLKGVSIFLDELYAVKIICDNNDVTTIEAGADAIQTALQGITGSVSGGKVIRCTRESPLKYTETVDGITYRHLGGTYRIYSQ